VRQARDRRYDARPPAVPRRAFCRRYWRYAAPLPGVRSTEAVEEEDLDVRPTTVKPQSARCEASS